MDLLLQCQRNHIPTKGKRICNKININNGLDKSFCWLWIGTVQDDKKGHQHGVIWYNKKYVQVHRIMYHNFIGDVPEYTYGDLIVLQQWKMHKSLAHATWLSKRKHK